MVKQLSTAGASITELNTVRRALSAVKGGRLARLAGPAPTLALILSDIVGDPLDLIASGPTVECGMGSGQAARSLLARYGMQDNVADNVRQALQKPDWQEEEGRPNPTENVLVGSNLVAVERVQEKCETAGCPVVTLTRSLTGDATEVGVGLAQLLLSLLARTDMKPSLARLGLAGVEEAVRGAGEQLETCGRLVLLAAGETTVRVTGAGRGGRNQQLVLAFRLELWSHLVWLQESGYTVELLSCGTDGLDGPTDSAGATWRSDRKPRLSRQETAAFLTNNDSYNYWLAEGGLVKTGHTGTNVADIIICSIFKQQ